MQTDEEKLREAARPYYGHCATHVCFDTAVVLDTPEVRYRNGDLCCAYCGGPVLYLKYWMGERVMQHTPVAVGFPHG